MTSGYREWAVPGAHAVIACRWQQHTESDGPGHVQRVLPDGCADIVVTGDGRAVVVGPTGQVALPELAPGSTLVGLRMRTEAIGAAFGVPGWELRDQELPLADVVGPVLARRAVDALLQPHDAGDVWIRSWISTIAVDQRTAAAVGQLWTGGGVDVASVARVVGLSCRQLRRVMLAEVGLGPKTVQRVGRLQRFLRVAENGRVSGGRPALAEWAAMAGYADQSHLARDITELAATTPARLLAERGA